MAGRAARTRAALDAMDPQQRLAMEGHRPGAYLRLRFTGAPPFPICLPRSYCLLPCARCLLLLKARRSLMLQLARYLPPALRAA